MPRPADSSSDRDPLDRLAEEFVARYRRGERPSLAEYAARLPDRADEVRDLFPALVEMEQLKPATGDRTGDFEPSAGPTDPLRVGEFRILRRIGQGGMGVVYEAVQESLGRHVALKMLPAEAVADPRRLERFRREAKSAARLHHTNIVPVFGIGAADGRHYYAMQFIAGHPLDAVIREVKRLRASAPAAPPAVPRLVSEVARALLTGTFAAPAPDPSDVAPTITNPGATGPAPAAPPDSSALSGTLSAEGHYWGTVARIGAQAADALGYAHAQGILHRDVKPANLLLDPRGTVWVADFGLAKASDADDLTHTGDIVGTLRYMAPERFDGGGDARADVYALGLTLYELLTLTPAFQGETRAKLVEQVLAASPPKPRTLNPAIPRDLETVVLKAIARDPAMRYPSAGELADDLRLYLEDRPIRARRASSAEQAFRWCRRNKAVASLLTAVLLVLAVGAGVSAFFAVRAEKNATEARGEADRADGERDRANAEAANVRAEQDRTRNLLYLARMADAGVAHQDNRIGRVLDLLRETTPAPGEPDPRGWEWHFLRRATTSAARVIPLPEIERAPPPEGQIAPNAYSLVWVSADAGTALVRRNGDAPALERWDLTAGRRLASYRPEFGSVCPEGRFAVRAAPGDKPEGGKLMVCELGTGREWPGPPEQVPGLNAADLRHLVESYSWGPLGPGGAYLVAAFGGDSDTPPGGKPVCPPLFVWRRSDGKTVRLDPKLDPDPAKTGTYGSAFGDPPFVASDGTLLQTNTWYKGRAGGTGDSLVYELQIDRWDLSAEPPKWLGASRVPGQTDMSTNDTVRARAAFSRNGQWYAFQRGRRVEVYRVADGRLEWSATLPDGQTLFGAHFGALPPPPLVADAGSPVVVADQLHSWLVVDRPDSAADPVGRVHRFHDDQARAPRNWGPEGIGRCAADGGSFVTVSETGISLRVWDLTRRPTVAAANRAPPRPRPAEATQVQFTADGRRALDTPVTVLKVAGTLSGLMVPESLTIRDGPTWGRVATYAPPAGFALTTCRFAAGGERILVTSISIDPADGSGGPERPGRWALLDAADGRQLAAGAYRDGVPQFWAGIVPHGPWLVFQSKEFAVEKSPAGAWQPVQEPDPDAAPPEPGRPRRRPKLVHRSMVLFDSRTGKEIGRPTVDDVPDFYPSERPPADAGGPILLHTATNSPPPGRAGDRGELVYGVMAIDAATGRSLWTQPEAVKQVSPHAVPFRYAYGWGVDRSPDGRRLALTTHPQRSGDPVRTWIGRAADGGTERVVELPAEPVVGPFFPVPRFAPDSRTLAVRYGNTVTVVDAGTGAVRHRLTGHPAPVTDLVYSTDGRRLFVYTCEPQIGVSRLSVWDTDTGRRLMEIPLAFEQPGAINNARAKANPLGQLLFRDGRVYVTTGDGVRVFDGSPPPEGK